MKWLRSKIAPKLFLTTFILVESVILILGAMYYRNIREYLFDNQTQYAIQIEKKSDEYLQLNLKTVQSFLLSIGNDFRLQTKTHTELKSWINNNLIYFIPNAQNIHILERNEVLVSTSTVAWFLTENQQFLDEIARMEEDNQVYWLGPYYSAASGYTLTAALRTSTQSGTEYLLLLDLNLEQLFLSLFPEKSSNVQGDLIILNAANEPIFGKSPYVVYDLDVDRFQLANGLEPDMFSKPWVELSVHNGDGEKLTIIRSQNNQLAWQIVLVMDNSAVSKPLTSTVVLTWIFALISVLPALAISLIVSVYISRPIKVIASQMNKVNLSNLDLAIRIDRKDELGLLANHFNRMGSRIRKLITELRRTEELKKQTEFKALQSQIRPHFLYNTLNQIGLSAKEGKMDEVDTLIASLTRQLHYSLDFSPAKATLKEELLSIQNYFELMNIRYGNRFVMETDIETQTLEYKIPKFTLQPFVENSIFHGLVPKEGEGLIFISTARYDNAWEILIEDNGVGMVPEKLTELEVRLNASSAYSIHEGTESIGIRNVHDRLRFVYGNSYRLTLSGKPGQGSRIILHLPLQEENTHE